MVEATAAKGLSASVYSQFSQRLYLKIRSEKSVREHGALSLSRRACICSTVLCREGNFIISKTNIPSRAKISQAALDNLIHAPRVSVSLSPVSSG